MSGHKKWSEIDHKRDNMTMKKTGDSERGLEVLRGHEASALDKLERRFGKRLSDFDDDERDTLHEELDAARKQNEADIEADAKANADAEDTAA